MGTLFYFCPGSRFPNLYITRGGVKHPLYKARGGGRLPDLHRGYLIRDHQKGETGYVIYTFSRSGHCCNCVVPPIRGGSFFCLR